MQFRLIYNGRLSGNARNPDQKHQLRKTFHPQIQKLLNYSPFDVLSPSWLNQKCPACILIERNGITYGPLISDKSGIRAELSILLLRPFPPGNILSRQADLDNQIKTLIDGLRVPDVSQNISLDDNPFYKNNPVFCLLEDDSLITGFSVETDRLLDSNKNSDAMAIIQVQIKSVKDSFANWAMVTGSLQ